MKLKKIIYAFLLAVILIAAGTGCRKSQFNINRDQNNPTDSTIAYNVVLPAALHASGVIIATQWGTIQNWMGYWARSGTYAPNVTEETYQITTGFGNGIWNNGYDNNYDYTIIIAKAGGASAGFYEGIGRIMKAHNFQILVDVYGNVPYTEALKGSGNPTPKYDNGIDIYKDLFRQIDKGIDLIQNSVASQNADIATNDIMFHGDKALWAKFGNTLKLRMIMHCYAVPGFPIAAEIDTINKYGYGYLGAGQDAQVNPGYAADKPNPFYGTYKASSTGAQTANNVYYTANKWGLDMYKGDGDPRQTRFYTAGSGGLIGLPYGLPPIPANGAGIVSSIGPGVYKSATASQCIMSAAESFFLQAEARERNIITSGPTAFALLTSGIVESFTYLGVPNPATAAASYVSGNASYPDVDYLTGVAQGPGLPVGGMFTILSQKWFAMNAIASLETWTDYRRVPYSSVATKPGASTTHFVYGEGGGFDPGPPISVAPQNTSTVIPVRYLYPQSEYNYNAANVGAQGTILSSSRIFWDIN